MLKLSVYIGFLVWVLALVLAFDIGAGCGLGCWVWARVWPLGVGFWCWHWIFVLNVGMGVGIGCVIVGVGVGSQFWHWVLVIVLTYFCFVWWPSGRRAVGPAELKTIKMVLKGDQAIVLVNSSGLHLLFSFFRYFLPSNCGRKRCFVAILWGSSKMCHCLF